MPCIWAMVHPDNEAEETSIVVLATGEDFEHYGNELFYKGSFNQGPYVWHVFDEIK